MKNVERIEEGFSKIDYNDLTSFDELDEVLDTLHKSPDIESQVNHDGISAEVFTVEEMEDIAQN